jgi:hypothetical protein
MGTPTLTFDSITRNGSTISATTNQSWGSYIHPSGNFDATDVTTWPRLMIHPYESVSDTLNYPNPRNSDTYRFNFTATANTTRGTKTVKRTYITWDNSTNAYDSTLEDLEEDDWPTNDSIQYTHSKSINDEITRYTYTFLCQGTADDYDEATNNAIADAKCGILHYMPNVRLNSISGSGPITVNYRLHQQAVDEMRITKSRNTSGNLYVYLKFITPLDSSGNFADTSYQGLNWSWKKNTSTINGGNISSTSLSTSSNGYLLYINNAFQTEGSATTISYYLELSFNGGLASTSYDRRIEIEVVNT